ncbi:MAG: DNA polymerase III subunit delta [Pseudomonadota bacterium]
MKVQGAAAERYCTSGDLSHGGVLLFGPDPAHTAEMRRRLVAALSGALGDGTAGFSLTRLDAAEVRRDPAALHDALRAGGFFADRPLVLLTGATDTLAPSLAAALDGLTPQDGILVTEAGALTAKSALRKLFEKGSATASVGLYPDPPDGPALATALRDAGLATDPSREALDRLAAHAAEADRGSLARTVERIALYGLDRPTPISAEEIAALLPATAEAETDALIAALAAGRPDAVAYSLGRLATAGVNEVTIVIQVGQYFRQLLAAACHPKGPQEGLATLRPPAWGARRDAMAAALRRWPQASLESALRQLQDTDRLLRSAGTRPNRAILERCLLRLAIAGAPTRR